MAVDDYDVTVLRELRAREREAERGAHAAVLPLRCLWPLVMADG
jgi:hypothetical protein